MDQELLELCKEVYKRFPSWQIEDSKWFVKTGPKSEWQVAYGPISSMMEGNIPIYTSDYLLEKLPGRVHKNGYSLDLRLSKVDDEYNFAYMDRLFGFHYMGISDTPLKALLKLVVALDDAGELK